MSKGKEQGSSEVFFWLGPAFLMASFLPVLLSFLLSFKAKKGDVQAAQLIISRVLPTLAAQSEKVEFELDTAASLAEQTEQVLAATSKGVLSPDSAQRIIQIIGALGEIRHLEDIEDRLAALEGNANV
tara:strand:+ start:12 stop:395 length:384 start_codon:yes stop_codon:yes gene_type:complete